jgi:hypothetical protein
LERSGDLRQHSARLPKDEIGREPEHRYPAFAQEGSPAFVVALCGDFEVLPTV